MEGTIAWKNFRRNAKRYRSIILSLMLSVVLYISASSFAADLQLLTEQVVVDMEGDILFWTQDMEEKEILGGERSPGKQLRYCCRRQKREGNTAVYDFLVRYARTDKGKNAGVD